MPALAGWTTVRAGSGGDLNQAMVEAAIDPSKGTKPRRGVCLHGFGFGLAYLETLGALFVVSWAVPPHLVMRLNGPPHTLGYRRSVTSA